MPLAKNLIEAAGNATQANYIEDVFSTYLYTGTASSLTITNNIDLSTKGGMVWLKVRSGTTGDHEVFDTLRGATNRLIPNATNAQITNANTLTAFNADGFSIGNYSEINGSGNGMASWTFRKQPKFFDVVTYTGNGTSGRTVAHSLGSVPGCIIVKRTDTVSDWRVYHRSLGATNFLALNSTNSAQTLNGVWNSTSPTDTNFTLGNNQTVNASGGTYVAYLFAHDAGGFGLTGTDNVISCGSFTTDGSGNATVNLGYEPQWVLYKPTSSASNWQIIDNMRGFSQTSATRLFPNTSGADFTSTGNFLFPTATGFQGNGIFLTSEPYIYIAIRRGPMKVPTDATKVFKPVTATVNSNNFSETTNFPVDLLISESRTGAISRNFNDRLRGGSATGMVSLQSTNTGAEGTVASHGYGFDYNTKIVDNFNYWNAGTDNFVYWNFQRAPSFFDEVCYTGTGSTNYAVTHNLGVAPELMIVRFRNLADNWYVYSKAAGGAGTYLILNSDNTIATGVTNRFPTDPTSTQFYVGNALNSGSYTSVAYLFATCAGVSKVGSYTGNGSTQAIACGFAGGARFVLIKRTDSTGDWYVWDTARGIVSGNDPYLLLNSTAAEVTSTDYIDTYSAGFELSSTAPAALNASGGTYIFLAIA